MILTHINGRNTQASVTILVISWVRLSFVENTFYRCYHNSIAVIAPLVEEEMEKEEGEMEEIEEEEEEEEDKETKEGEVKEEKEAEKVHHIRSLFKPANKVRLP